MANFAEIKAQLDQYNGFAYHNDTALHARLREVQAWQKQRMQTLHATLFGQKDHDLIQAYFLNRLYGANDFDALASEFERMIGKLAKIEKYAPESAIDTGVLGVKLAVLAIALDQQLAVYLNQQMPQNTPINEEWMLKAYLATQQAEARIELMDLLVELGLRLDQYVRSFVIYTAFKMAKGKASKHGFELLYQFMDQGFAAMKPLKSAKQFIQAFSQAEKQMIVEVYGSVVV